MKKFLIAVLVLAVLGGGGYGAYYYFYASKKDAGSERVSSESDDAIFVDSVSMLAGLDAANGMTDRYGGETVAQATLEVKTDTDQKIKETYVKEGDLVKEGDKLFAYDTTENEDTIEKNLIEIERSEAEIEQSHKAIENYEKQQKSANEDDKLAITTSILSEENAIKTNEYNIKTKEKENESLKEKIANAVVTAEMAGIIQKVNDSSSTSSSDWSSTGDDSSYITILATGDFRIQGKVNEQNIQNIYEGMPMIVFSRVDEKQRWYGMITKIDTDQKDNSNSNNGYYGESGADSSSYKFYVELDDSEGLMLGQHVYMEENIGQDKVRNGIWLPASYLMEENGEYYIWKAGADNMIHKEKITVGQYDEEAVLYEITEGIAAEDYIAFPMDDITEGLPVNYNEVQEDYAYTGDDSFGEEGDYQEFEEGDEGFDVSIGFEDEDGAFEEISPDDEILADDGEDIEYFDADADMEEVPGDIEFFDADAENGVGGDFEYEAPGIEEENP